MRIEKEQQKNVEKINAEKINSKEINAEEIKKNEKDGTIDDIADAVNTVDGIVDVDNMLNGVSNKDVVEMVNDIHNNTVCNCMDMKCRYCENSEALIKYAGYQRMKVEMQCGKIELHLEYVPRMYCKSCKRTFNVLNENQIKNSAYGNSFIQSVLEEYNNRKEETVTELCERYQIAISTLYRWKKEYNGNIKSKAEMQMHD